MNNGINYYDSDVARNLGLKLQFWICFNLILIRGQARPDYGPQFVFPRAPFPYFDFIFNFARSLFIHIA